MSFVFTSARAPLDSARDKSHSYRREDGSGIYPEPGRRVNPEPSRRARAQKQTHKTLQQRTHMPVMLKEVIELLSPRKGDVVVDATYGSGGHSEALRRAAKIKLIALDADPRGKNVIEGNFGNLAEILKKEKVVKVDKVLFDLGWNLEQLAGKGMSFLHDEPLSMSYGKQPASGFTAREIVNTWSEKVLADILFGYAQERYARRIAAAIVARRALKPIETTIELAEIVKDVVPPAYRHGRLHPATKTFQALRVAVNDELRCLQRGLDASWEALACGGRVAVISFHSLEDRIVKRTFIEWAKKDGHLITKKPTVPRRDEISSNPPSRSAKLRVIEKVCNE